MRAASSNQPGRRAETKPLCRPYSVCSRWGLPCRFRYRSRGALLPHPFTMTVPKSGRLLSVALSLGSPPPALPAPSFARSPDFPRVPESTRGRRPSDGSRPSAIRRARERRRPAPPPGPPTRYPDGDREGAAGAATETRSTRGSQRSVIPLRLGSSSASRIMRHSASISPSISSGRKRRWNAMIAAIGSVTS